MKKLTSILMSALILISSAALMTTTASAVESKDFEYEVTSAGNVVITEYVGKDAEVTVPGAIEGKPVTALGSYSFAYNKTLESVIIPTGVKSIGDSAFSNCEKLSKVSIPETVTSIRDSAFQYTEKLTQVTLPSKITTISSCLFYSSGIKSVNIPEGVKKIESTAFFDCENLESVSMPDTVNEIDYSVFSECKNLQSVHLSKNLKVLPGGVFSETESLTEISLPSKITKIGSQAFWMSGIKKVSIGKNIKTIEEYAFDKCPKLTAIKVNKKNKNYYSKNGVLYNKKKTELITYPGGKSGKKFTVGKDVRKITAYAFSGNAKLDKVSFKKGVKTISGNSFEESSIKSLKLPVTVKKIGHEAFIRCDSLESVTIPESVELIKDNAFTECKSLKKLTFKGNSKLELGWSVFEGCTALKTVSAPVAKKSGGRLFFACTKLNKVKISKNVKMIFCEDYAECPNLNKVTIPATVKKIGYRAFGYINYYDYSFDKNDNLVIKGTKNSAAHKYAKDNGFTFKKIKK